jgi:hypothetical protein
MLHTRDPQSIEIGILTAALQESTTCLRSVFVLFLASNWTLPVYCLMLLFPKNNRQEQARLRTPFYCEEDDRQITDGMIKCLAQEHNSKWSSKYLGYLLDIKCLRNWYEGQRLSFSLHQYQQYTKGAGNSQQTQKSCFKRLLPCLRASN